MRHLFFAIILPLILSWSLSLTGCSLSTAEISPSALLSVFSEPFACTFSADGPEDSITDVTLTRTEDGDCFTAGGAQLLFREGAWELFVPATPEEEALTVPVVPGESGAALWRTLFSVTDDGKLTLSHSEEGLTVSDRTGTFTAVFTEDGTPLRLSAHGVTVKITAFRRGTP